MPRSSSKSSESFNVLHILQVGDNIGIFLTPKAFNECTALCCERCEVIDSISDIAYAMERGGIIVGARDMRRLDQKLRRYYRPFERSLPDSE